MILSIDRRSRVSNLVRQFLLAVDHINIYGSITTSAAFPYAVILLSASTLLNWAEAYLHAKWHVDPSSHLATTDMD